MIFLRRTTLVLLALSGLLGAVYLAHEIQSLAAGERAIGQIYERQIETLLFSVNQHALDVATSRFNELDRATGFGGPPQAEAAQRLLDDSDIEAVFFLGREAGSGLLIDSAGARRPDGVGWIEAVRDSLAKAGRPRRSRHKDFRPLTSIRLRTPGGQPHVALVYPLRRGNPDAETAGFLIPDSVLIESVLAPKLREVARESFTVAVFDRSHDSVVFANGALKHPESMRRRSVWILPDHEIGIEPRDRSVQQILRERFFRSLILISLLVSALGVGVWLVVRNARREVELAGMRSDFVSNVSHELRTPLALIRMYAETLELNRVPSEDKRKEYFRTIRREAERLTRLVDNILSFSRLEAGRKEYRFAGVDLNEVVTHVMASYEGKLEQEGFTIRVARAEGLPPVRGDAHTLQEVLINLIDNAAKYSRDERRIDVATGQEGERVFVEVADRGIGIPATEQERIFEPFYRVGKGLVHEARGSGLGLAIVKQVVEAHGGSIRLDSTPGEGSRFRIWFNRLPDRIPDEPPASYGLNLEKT